MWAAERGLFAYLQRMPTATKRSQRDTRAPKMMTTALTERPAVSGTSFLLAQCAAGEWWLDRDVPDGAFCRPTYSSAGTVRLASSIDVGEGVRSARAVRTTCWRGVGRMLAGSMRTALSLMLTLAKPSLMAMMAAASRAQQMKMNDYR